MKIRAAFLLAPFMACALAASSCAEGETDKQFTKQVSEILLECGKIKPGMTRGDLLKVFTTEGGISTARHRTFVHRRCPYVKVEVEFAPSEQKQGVLEVRGTDPITKISKPYLEWSILD